MPRAIFRDPFRGGDNVMVLSECFTPALWGVAVGVHSAAIVPESRRAVLFSGYRHRKLSKDVDKHRGPEDRRIGSPRGPSAAARS